MEEWRPVPGWEGLYEVSSHGRVRSLLRLDHLGRRVNGRMLKNTQHNAGYWMVRLSSRPRHESHLVHRLVARAFLGEPADGQEVCHNDGDRSNTLVENLRWGTRSENCFDKRGHGTDVKVNRTHCPRDHPLTFPNLVAWTARRGYRACLACQRTRSWFRKHPDVSLDLFDDVATTYLWKIFCEESDVQERELGRGQGRRKKLAAG